MRIHTSLSVSNLAFSLLAWRGRQLLACPLTFFKIPHSFVVLLTAMTSSRSFWKDPLEVLPHLPHPLPLPRSVTVKLSCMKLLTRVNETISCLRGLYKGELVNGQQEVANVSRSSIKAGWSHSTGPQRQLVRRVWDAHAEWMAEEILHDDDTALTQMLRAVPVALQTEPLTKAPEPVRGDLCACVASEVSLPPPGATPVPLKDISPDAAEFFAAWQSSMLRSDSEVDWEEYEKIKPYQSPELQSKKVRLELLLRMWLSGMLSTCSTCCEEVKVFTVLKKYENGIRSSRLVWDLRRANLRWRTPPWVPLGSPISIGCLDLAEDLLEGRTLSSCQGDLPDFFYTLLLPNEMWPYFVFSGTSPQELKEYAHQQGVEIPIDAAHAHLCLIVLPMGWAWAVFLAHSALQSIFQKGIADIDPRGQLIDGMPTPQFNCFSKLFWLYIDDFAVTQLEAKGQDTRQLEAVETLKQCREAITGTGLRVHKEQVDYGVGASLGVEVTQGLRMRTLMQKQSTLAAATRALLKRGKAGGKELEVLMGSWVWVMMPCRLVLSVCEEVYGFIHAHIEEPAVRLGTKVMAELSTLLSLLPLIYVNLAAPWSNWTYMVDASNEGYGVVATAASPSELRSEAQWAERRGWVVSLEKSYSELEEMTHAGLEEARSDRARAPAMMRPRFLELFSGSGRLAAAIKESKLGLTEVWDIIHGPEYDLTNPARVAHLLKRIKQRHFWMVHLGPPCASFSIARLPRVRSRDHPWGLPNLVGKAKKLVEDGTYLCLLAIEIALACIAAGIHFSFENPASSMMWDFPPMRKLLDLPEVFQVTLHYCRYGVDWKKPTILMSNFLPLRRLGLRCNHSAPHQILRGLSPTGELWTKVACPYPLELCRAYAELARQIAPSAASIPHSMAQAPIALKEMAPRLADSWLVPSRWHLVYQGTWRDLEHNNILEARTAVNLLRHVARDPSRWGEKLLVFTDSLVTLGILTKGRSSVHVLNRLCRKAAAIVLSTGLKVYWRWVPSEVNYSDGPSRGEDVGVAEDTQLAHRWRGFPAHLIKHLPSSYQRAQEQRGFAL